MVVAAQPEATEAGADVLAAGGNAVDAAVACALVQGVVDPLMCGIAGFGSCAVWDAPTGAHRYIDFHAPAPAAVRSDMWQDLIEAEARDGYGFVLAGRVNDVGYQSICVPTGLRGYHDVHRAHGRLPWDRVVEPAIAWAEQGWTVRRDVAWFWSVGEEMGRVANHERIAHTAASRALYCRPDGTPKQVGDRVVNRDLGRTLREIARHGADVFYAGEIAHAIVEDMRRNDGLIAADDLRRARSVRSDPIWGVYRGLRVASSRPPGGGVLLLQMLQVLEHFPLRELGHNTPAYVRVVAEAMKQATRDKDRHVGDPAFVDVPVARLLGRDRAARLADDIRAGRRAHVPRVNPGGADQRDTTHVCVVDADGSCVSMTHSLGMPSGVVTPGLGFMYNGCMGVFDPRPGRAGSLAPGKARFSSIAPTIVFDGDAPRIVIGAPGGTQIAMGLLQALLNAIDFDMTMTEAVSAPRFSATSNAIDVSNRIPFGVQRALEADGYEVIRSPRTFGFARVHGIRIHPDGLDGGADPGSDGIVMAV